MKSRTCEWVRSLLATSLIFTTFVALNAQQQADARDLPDSPGAVVAQNHPAAATGSQAIPNSNPAAPTPVDPTQTQSTQTVPQQPAPQSAAPVQQPAAPAETQPPQAQTQPPSGQSTHPARPAGTAVAETPSTVGVAASNPAGAAIAPAKQRRVRVFLISVGAIVGAGVALGTVAALSAGSPSRPPGAH